MANIIYGSASGDTLSGTGTDDVNYGLAGGDVIDGGSGNDIIYGGDGNDTINGFGDNDVIYGDAGNDNIRGYAGNDTLYGGRGNDILIGDTGDDVMVVEDIGDRVEGSGNNGNDTMQVMVDNYFVRGQVGIETVVYGDGVKKLPYFIDDMIRTDHPLRGDIGEAKQFTYSFMSSDANDPNFQAYTEQQKQSVRAAFAKYSALTGLTFTETSESNDVFHIKFGSSELGENVDGNVLGVENTGSFIVGSNGVRSVNGASVIHTQKNYDSSFITLADGECFTTLLHEIGHALGMAEISGSYASALLPSVENNNYNTIMSYDRAAGLGVNELQFFDVATMHYLHGVNHTQRTGNDTYGFSNRYVWDGAGADTFNAANQTQAVAIDLRPGSWNFVGSQSTSILAAGQSFIGFDTYIENAVGGSGNDTLTGNALGNNLNGGSGNDSISGGDGGDILKGSLGTDTLDGGVGSDWADYRGTSLAVTVNLATTTAQNTGGWGTDTLVNIENVFGGLGNDSLTGNALGNTIRGGLGNDFMSGDVIGGTAGGNDYVDYRDITTVDLTIDLSLTTAQITGAGTDTILNFESIYSGAANDRLTGNNLANQLLAYAGNDTLSGGLGNDGLQGGVGNDTYLFQRGAGADTLTEADSTAGNSDLLWFDTNVTSSQLWFQHTGNNLVVSVIGTSDKVTLSNWYTGSANQVETIKASDGKTLSNAKVDALVSAMSVFAIPAVGTTTLPTSYQTSLNPVLAANWV